MQATSFSPSSITVTRNAGTATVGFQNESGVHHNILFDSANPAGSPADIGSIDSPTTVTRTFGSPGTFNLHCTIHGGMTAVVVVN